MTPLILLHGIGTGPGAWGPQIEALAPEREVVAPDLVGAYARGWEAALDEVRRLTTQHREVDLCGLSLGGLIALQIAAERSLVGERVIVCAAFRGLPPGLRRRVHAMAMLTRLMPRGFCTASSSPRSLSRTGTVRLRRSPRSGPESSRG